MFLEQYDTVIVVQTNKTRIAHVSTPSGSPSATDLRIAAAVIANYILQASRRPRRVAQTSVTESPVWIAPAASVTA
jgi:hypothetical protein